MISLKPRVSLPTRPSVEQFSSVCQLCAILAGACPGGKIRCVGAQEKRTIREPEGLNRKFRVLEVSCRHFFGFGLARGCLSCVWLGWHWDSWWRCCGRCGG